MKEVYCRFSGPYDEGLAGSLSFSEGPRVVLFLSDESVTSLGFTIGWQEAPFTGDERKTGRLSNPKGSLTGRP